MEKTSWLGRKRAAMAMARAANCSEARLIHYQQAGRLSVKAAFAPFLLPRKGPATEGEREALRAPRALPPRNMGIIRRPPPSPRGHKPGDGA